MTSRRRKERRLTSVSHVKEHPVLLFPLGQSPGPLTLLTKRRGIPRMQSPHGRDGQRLGFSVMSSPESTKFVPPPGKKRRMWSLSREMVQSCVQASSAYPQHTMFRGLLTAIPQVQVQRTQPPKECGLLSSSTSSQVYCYKARKPLVAKQIKNPLSHPSSVPRVQGNKNIIISKNREIIRALNHTDPGRFSLCPLDGASTPSMESVQQNPLDLHQERVF